MTGTDGRLPLLRETVRPEWIDYNGHLSEAFYVLVFGHATDALMAEAGLDAGYRARTGCSLYTVEAHLRYLREVTEGARLVVRTRVLGVDAKRVRCAHEMFAERPQDPEDGAGAAGDDTVDTGDTVPAGGPVATAELLALHVDQEAGRAVPLPEQPHAVLAGLTGPAPGWAGRSVGAVPRPE
ncbi:thioesterase family protein [Streptomyces sp. JJ36]|uniref:thioesterase family protein n=1 Tax=Streptomyces sp. JJ36 TaxID=2736645 RepID=UPI001F207863|nr:thioesterase family protein [Streptomyces sp. JJ36]MCF6524689.1 thioesterase family protein [Streptomyces sp. JJ36]